MPTSVTKSGKYHYWQKSLIVVVLALVLMTLGYFLDNEYLQWSAGGVFVIAAWYGIMSLFELIDH